MHLYGRLFGRLNGRMGLARERDKQQDRAIWAEAREQKTALTLVLSKAFRDATEADLVAMTHDRDARADSEMKYHVALKQAEAEVAEAKELLKIWLAMESPSRPVAETRAFLSTEKC
jgi:hypothetical protein